MQAYVYVIIGLLAAVGYFSVNIYNNFKK